MKHKRYIIVAAVLFIAAIWLTFLTPPRLGIHDDSRTCSENPRSKTFVTATGYLLSTQPVERVNSAIGSCPYQAYEAKTYALELWIAAIVFEALPFLLSISDASRKNTTNNSRRK